MPFSFSKLKSSSQVTSSNNEDGIELELEAREHSVRTQQQNPSNVVHGTRSSDASSIDEYRYQAQIDSPAIANNTEYPIVVFLERGVLYNKQVLRPGEAITLTKKQTGGILPYRIHAVLGDDAALPTRKDSLKNLAKVSAVPVAFVAGCLATAAVAGTLAGPAVALAPLVSGMVVKGVVIDASTIAAGAYAANTTKKIAEKVMEDHTEKLVGVTGMIKPGRKYFSVRGGLSNGPVEIKRIRKYQFNRLEIVATKVLEK